MWAQQEQELFSLHRHLQKIWRLVWEFWEQLDGAFVGFHKKARRSIFDQKFQSVSIKMQN